MSSQNGRKVLVVDDDLLNQELMAAVLEERGYTVLTAGDGSDGLGILEKDGEIRIVVTDILMPNKEGIGFIRSIRTKRPDIKIVAITGAVNYQKIFATAQDFGADLTLKKPFDIDTFANTIDELNK